MSMLALRSRPWTVFDPKNKDHRKQYNTFMKHKTWGKCPYRFIIIDGHGDHITLNSIQRNMIEYYLSKEFKNTV